MRFVFTTITLMFVYALSIGSVHPWDLGLGAILGLAVVLAFRGFLFTEQETALGVVLRRAAHFPYLMLGTVLDITRGTIDVARIVLSPRVRELGGFVDIPYGNRTHSGVVVSGLISTLSPGSVLIDIDPDARTWTMHVIDATDEEGVIAYEQEFYERYQRAVWP